MFGLNINITSIEEMNDWLEQERVHYVRNPANAEEMALSHVGRRLYYFVYKPLMIEQWNQFPTFLGPKFASDIPPVVNSLDSRYYSDSYQAVPAAGYEAMFDNLLQHDNIDVATNVDYMSV
jgi:UDP-galactopyranose mutase